MQTSSPSLLMDAGLKIMAVDIEKEDALRSLLGYLNAVEGRGMEYVLSNPRFQVAWRKACKTFDFFSGDVAKCSASNIEAFREMVEKTYPDLYKELSLAGVLAIKEIKKTATTRSHEVLNA